MNEIKFPRIFFYILFVFCFCLFVNPFIISKKRKRKKSFDSLSCHHHHHHYSNDGIEFRRIFFLNENEMKWNERFEKWIDVWNWFLFCSLCVCFGVNRNDDDENIDDKICLLHLLLYRVGIMIHEWIPFNRFFLFSIFISKWCCFLSYWILLLFFSISIFFTLILPPTHRSNEKRKISFEINKYFGLLAHFFQKCFLVRIFSKAKIRPEDK